MLLKAGDILVHGHTHLLKAESKRPLHLKPGSTSIPKGGQSATYAILMSRISRSLTFDGNVVKEAKLGLGKEWYGDKIYELIAPRHFGLRQS